MSLDLKLLPVTGDAVHGFAHTIIECDRDKGLFDRIAELKPQELPISYTFATYLARIPDGSMQGESCYGRITEDAYGARLTWLMAGQLQAAFFDCKSIVNKAARAYLRTTPNGKLVVLYWS